MVLSHCQPKQLYNLLLGQVKQEHLTGLQNDRRNLIL